MPKPKEKDTNKPKRSTFGDIGRALEEFRTSEGYGANEPITYGDLYHVAQQLEAGRNADGSEKKAATA